MKMYEDDQEKNENNAIDNSLNSMNNKRFFTNQIVLKKFSMNYTVNQ